MSNELRRQTLGRIQNKPMGYSCTRHKNSQLPTLAKGSDGTEITANYTVVKAVEQYDKLL